MFTSCQRLSQYSRTCRNCYNALVALQDGEWKVEIIESIPGGAKPQITIEELIRCEEIVRNDAKVQALAREVGALVRRITFLLFLTCSAGIEPHQIAADGWVIGWDDRFPQSQRLQQAFVFGRFSQHENLYAHPLVRTLCLSRAILLTDCSGLYSGRGRDRGQGCPN